AWWSVATVVGRCRYRPRASGGKRGPAAVDRTRVGICHAPRRHAHHHVGGDPALRHLDSRGVRARGPIMPPMRLRLALIAVCVSASVSVLAQVRQRPTETGPWRPWSFTAVAHARQSRGATAAEVRAFEARLQELAAIVKQAPAVSPPIGFAGELWGSLNSHYPEAGQPPGRAVPLAGALSVGAGAGVRGPAAGTPGHRQTGAGRATADRVCR